MNGIDPYDRDLAQRIADGVVIVGEPADAHGAPPLSTSAPDAGRSNEPGGGQW
jgi:hypothetical protein